MTAPVERYGRTPRYLIAGNKPWIRGVLNDMQSTLPGTWQYVDSREALDEAVAREVPRYVFFVHWSHLVPASLHEQVECVCFHMTDVPFGRGGSPLQNLIVRGIRETQLTALRMVAELDAGPVYHKRPLSLEGGAEEIYLRMTRTAVAMIADIVRGQPTPVPQEGEPVLFQRRTPEQSRVPSALSLTALFDHLRMLDATGYPHAFLEHEGFRYEFSRATLYDGRIVADVSITPLADRQ